MNTTTAARAFAAALTLSASLAPKLAFADIKDYEFQLVEPAVQAGAALIQYLRPQSKEGRL
jgi:hypothetical protein